MSAILQKLVDCANTSMTEDVDESSSIEDMELGARQEE